MTVVYKDSFSNSLLKWRGSIYKAILVDFVVFYVIYYAIFLWQYSALNNQGKTWFAKFIVWFESGTDYIPLNFLLGFYVLGTISRWWMQFNWLSWPDKLMIVVTACLGASEHRHHRRTIARWTNLQSAIVWRLISIRTKTRFPTLDHLVDAGLMSPAERVVYENTTDKFGWQWTADKWYAPCSWITNLVRRLHDEGAIDSVQQKMLIEQLLTFRTGFMMLRLYDWVHIPLVYTQVVYLATYGYFALCLVGRQPKLDDVSRSVEATIYIPLFTTLQMCFYIGWLKVGVYAMQPFGEDDDDFELNYILDRNLDIAFLIGDVLNEQCPSYDEFDPFDNKFVRLPHTRASIRIRDVPPEESMARIRLKEKEMTFLTEEELARATSEQKKQSPVSCVPFNKANEQQEHY